MKALHIDGVRVEAVCEGLMLPHRRFYQVGVYGKTLDDRRAVVARHSVPTEVLDHGGSARTGGHLYEFKEVPEDP